MPRQVVMATGVVWALGLLGDPQGEARAQATVAGRVDGQTDGQQPSARDRARAAAQKGRALDQSGDLAGALQQLREAAQLDGENAAILSELGALALRSKDLTGAETATQKAIQFATSPSLLATANYTLGRIYEEQGDRPKAIAAFLESLRTHPTPEARLCPQHGQHSAQR